MKRKVIGAASLPLPWNRAALACGGAQVSICGGRLAREAANAGPATPAMRRARSTQTRKTGAKAAF